MKIRLISLACIFAASLFIVSCKSTEQEASATETDVEVATAGNLDNEKSGTTTPFRDLDSVSTEGNASKSDESASAKENSNNEKSSSTNSLTASSSSGASNLGVTTPEAIARQKAAQESQVEDRSVPPSASNSSAKNSLVATGNSSGNSGDGSDQNAQAATREPQEGELLLDGKLYTKEEIEARGGVSIWDCRGNEKNSSNKILWTFGYFNDSKDRGFMLTDGGRKGTEEEVYHRAYDGNERWNWQVDKNDYFTYSFIIEPDSMGYYYQFPLEPHVASPKTTYKTKKR